MSRRWTVLVAVALFGCSAPDGAERSQSAAALDALGARFGALPAPRVPSEGVALALPSTLADRVHLDSGGATLDVRLLDAAAVPSVRSSGFLVFAGGAPGGGAVVHRPTSSGFEDYVVIERGAELRSLRWEVGGSGWAGLRLVSNTLEFLAADGTPKFRVSPPHVIDAARIAHGANLSVEGCRVDRSARPPWGRSPVDPGSEQCVVAVSWSPGIEPPVLVDPGWAIVGALAAAREGHGAVRLDDGRVLVAGGDGSPSEPTLTELFDPATNTWAAAGDLSTGRDGFALVKLQDGSVLAIGGGLWDSATSTINRIASTERYDPASGTWTVTASMSAARSSHTATVLGDGRVLVVGGYIEGATQSEKSTELYDPASNTFQAGPPSTSLHYRHQAVLLPDGRVLVVDDSATEIFDPATATWQRTSPMLEPNRDAAALVVLPDGRVLAAGGSDNYTGLSSAEVYDPVTDEWAPAGSMRIGRDDPAAALVGGRVLVSGGAEDGLDSATIGGTVDLFDPSTSTWTAADDMTWSRKSHTATRLSNDQVLVAGGQAPSSKLRANSELFSLVATGGSCADCGDCVSGLCIEGTCSSAPAPDGTACQCEAACASGHCVDGVCCDTVCDGPCEGCTSDRTNSAAGQCAPISAGTDPDDECSVDPSDPGSCQDEPVCDGARACTCTPRGAATCLDDRTSLQNGTATPCAPYVCSLTGECRTTCRQTSDCLDGAVCNSGECVMGGNAAEDDGGCGCRTPGTRRHPAPASLLLLGLVISVLRRNRP